MVQIGMDLEDYYPSVEWDILSVPAERHEKYYPCCVEPYIGKNYKNCVHTYTYILQYLYLFICLEHGSQNPQTFIHAQSSEASS